jgi:hypothetical protein
MRMKQKNRWPIGQASLLVVTYPERKTNNSARDEFAYKRSAFSRCRVPPISNLGPLSVPRPNPRDRAKFIPRVYSLAGHAVNENSSSLDSKPKPLRSPRLRPIVQLPPRIRHAAVIPAKATIQKALNRHSREGGNPAGTANLKSPPFARLTVRP